MPLITSIHNSHLHLCISIYSCTWTQLWDELHSIFKATVICKLVQKIIESRVISANEKNRLDLHKTIATTKQIYIQNQLDSKLRNYMIFQLDYAAINTNWLGYYTHKHEQFIL